MKEFTLSEKSLPKFQYNGARTLIILHDKNIRSFFNIWMKAKILTIALPITDDKDYVSLEALLRHVLRSSGGYITWICEQLELPNPHITKPPELNTIEKEGSEYIEYLLSKWRTPLIEIEEGYFHSPSYKSRWGADYCIEAMLEHAVMHPLRHEFQLAELIKKQS